MSKSLAPLFVVALLGANAALAVAACSSTPSPGADAGTDGSTASDASSDAAPWDSGGVPGGPPGINAPIQAVINGQLRTFGDAGASTSKDLVDGGAIGVQVQGTYQAAQIFIVAWDDTQSSPACPAGAFVTLSLGSGQSRAEWGGAKGSPSCMVQFTQYGRAKGARVQGTFSGELDLTRGDSPIQHLSVSQGTFDVVQLVDPPQ